MPRRFADVKHEVFARHSNPWSAWTRWLSTPLVLVPSVDAAVESRRDHWCLDGR